MLLDAAIGASFPTEIVYPRPPILRFFLKTLPDGDGCFSLLIWYQGISR